MEEEVRGASGGGRRKDINRGWGRGWGCWRWRKELWRNALGEEEEEEENKIK